MDFTINGEELILRQIYIEYDCSDSGDNYHSLSDCESYCEGECLEYGECFEVIFSTICDGFINECGDCVTLGSLSCIQGCDGNWENEWEEEYEYNTGTRIAITLGFNMNRK